MIFLLRHGQIKDSKKKRYIGRTDIPLDDTGILQAEYWQKIFSIIKINRILSSSLSRCFNTAKTIAGKQEIMITPELNEIDMGAWDGLSFEQIKNNHPKEFEKRGKNLDSFIPPRGESFYDLSCRTIPLFNQINNNLQGNALIITHAGVIRTILCHIQNIKLKNLFQIKIAYGELFVLGSASNKKKI